jgi:hypothetical protein
VQLVVCHADGVICHS